jgi:hypothetical protein
MALIKSILNYKNKEGIMKTSILITATFSLIFIINCSTTTYVSITENNKEQIEQKLKYDVQDENVGAGVSLFLRDKTEFKGELLYVQDSNLTICTEHSAKEEELANLTYPINTIQSDEIQELTIKGSNYLWTGVGYGAAGGAALLGIIVYATYTEGTSRYFSEGIFTRGGQTAVGIIFGALAGSIAGGVVGHIFSRDDVILQQIPPGYDMSFLKPLARYQDEEPEYLRAIR